MAACRLSRLHYTNFVDISIDVASRAILLEGFIA
eukprot:SAG25_NODE_339_length_9497_cov_2.975109_4_plen_34_part_00